MFALAVTVFLTYWPAARCDFVTFDDPDYVYKNFSVTTGLSPRNIAWAFTTLHGGVSYWHPVTWISHQLDCQIFGLNPGAHHLTNVVLHTVSACLLFSFVSRLTQSLWRGLMVAAFFGLHPLHVESVAWVSERKDVLYGLFWMLTIAAYLKYVERRTWGSYSAVLLAFLFALMSKPMAVTIPLTLLIVDYWPLRRFERFDIQTSATAMQKSRHTLWLVTEKIPFFVFSFAVGILTWVAQKDLGATMSIENLSLSARLETAMIAYAAYVAKMLWPSKLCALYLHPHDWPWWLAVGAGWFSLSMWLIVIRLANRTPYAIAGWLWYTATLLPVTGILQVGSQWMADRYSYVPLIGLYIVVVWGTSDLFLRLKLPRTVVFGLAGGAAACCLFLTCLQIAHWKNSQALYQRILYVAPDNPIAHNNLGTALYRRGNETEAIFHFYAALRENPDSVQPNINLGDLYLGKGQIERAIQFYARGLNQLQYAELAHCALAHALLRRGEKRDSIAHYVRALVLRPNSVVANINLASILATDPDAKIRNGPEAVPLAERACKLTREQNPEFLNILASAYTEASRFSEAVKTGEKALKLAQSRKMTNLTTIIQQRLALFRLGKTDLPGGSEKKAVEASSKVDKNPVADPGQEMNH